MNPGEHELMARVEETHWWYRGLRDAIARCLARPDLALPAHPRVLDAGCGTGANLQLLSTLLAPSYLGGFDLSPEAVSLARRKLPAHAGAIVTGDIRDPPVGAPPLDLVLSMDVVCIPGLARSRAGLEQLVAALAPGGLLLLNLPALRWLYSEHDAAVHTTERYTRGQIASLLASLGLVPAILSYRLFFHLPLIALARLPRMLGARDRGGAARSDLNRVPGRLENRLLLAPLRLENALLARGMRFPWGSSVFAVGRKAGGRG